MNNFIIGFSRSKRKCRLLSKGIMWWDKTNFSHVYIRRTSKFGEYVYQASQSMVNFMHIDTFKQNNEIVKEFLIYITDEQFNEVLKEFVKQAGKPYGIKQLFAIVLTRFGISPKKYLNANDYFICSELVAVILDKMGLVFLTDWGVPQDLITPKMVYEKLEYLL